VHYIVNKELVSFYGYVNDDARS